MTLISNRMRFLARPQWLSAALVATSCLLVACQPTPPTEKQAVVAPIPDAAPAPAPIPSVTPIPGSLAQITLISPDASQALRSGERVKLKVDVNYFLAEDSGTIKLLILAADNSDLGQASTVVSKGNGNSTLETEFTVPNTSVVRVYTPLLVHGNALTPASDGRTFEVVQAK